MWAYFQAIGLRIAGPQFTLGQRPRVWPEGLDEDSLNVPTWSGVDGDRQLDWVAASHSLVDRLTVNALNGPEEWGPSDHCRILIEIET